MILQERIARVRLCKGARCTFVEFQRRPLRRVDSDWRPRLLTKKLCHNGGTKPVFTTKTDCING